MKLYHDHCAGLASFPGSSPCSYMHVYNNTNSNIIIYDLQGLPVQRSHVNYHCKGREPGNEAGAGFNFEDL